MQSDNDILNELQSLSPLLIELYNKNVFSVPEGYFQILSDTIVANAVNEVTIPASTEPFKVPEGYFDTLSAILLNKVKIAPGEASEELKLLSPLLYSLQLSEVFAVPPQYFSEVPITLINKLKIPAAKVVKISNFRKILRYAAAAILFGVLSLSVYKYNENPFPPSAASIISATLTPSIEKGKSMNEQQFNEELHVLSNEDISIYLEKNGSEEDISLITPNLKEEDLPSKDAYFLDDNILENYLGSN